MSDRTAIVLGGSAGVGHAAVEALIDRGYRVGTVARGAARLREMEERFGDRIATRPADVGDTAALEEAIAALIDTLGAPEVWVNSAMVTAFSPFERMEPGEFDHIVRTCLLGQVNGTRLALRHMPRGHIVCVGSGLNYRSVPYQSAYCASKHGISGFVSSVRSELLRETRPLSIGMVQLPAMNTPQFDWALNRMEMKPQPAPPIYQPKVAADAILQSVDTRARELFVGQSVLKLTFGTLVAPDWLDRVLSTSGVSSQKSERPEPGGRPANLDGPTDYPATAQGSFDDRAEDSAIVIDGDRARKIAFGGLAVAGLVVGLVLGLILGLLIG